MAQRRMFAMTIIDSDAFLDMPLSAQALYFHLSMRADDEGFINNPKRIQRAIGASDDDMKLLNAKNFVIRFGSGIVVIKHWRIHNYIRGDRLKGTVYAEERKMLDVKGNGAYTIKPELTRIAEDGAGACQSNVSHLSDKCQSNVSQMTDACPANVGIGKDRLDKVSIGEVKEINARARTREEKPVKHRYGEYNNVLLSDDEMEKLKAEFPNDWQERIDNLSRGIASHGYKYKNHLATIRNWARRDEARKPSPKQGSAEELDDFYRMVADWAKEDDG